MDAYASFDSLLFGGGLRHLKTGWILRGTTTLQGKWALLAKMEQLYSLSVAVWRIARHWPDVQLDVITQTTKIRQMKKCIFCKVLVGVWSQL